MANYKIYREAGGKWIVDVLSDKTDDHGMRRVHLCCIEQLRPSPIGGPLLPGHLWEACAKQGFEAYVGWTLDLE